MHLALLFVLASFGFGFVAGYSKISLPLRSWLASLSVTQENPASVRFAASWILSLLECPACLAFWLGAAASFTGIASAELWPISAPWYFLAPVLGLANCGAVLALGMITGLIRTE